MVNNKGCLSGAVSTRIITDGPLDKRRVLIVAISQRQLRILERCAIGVGASQPLRLGHETERVVKLVKEAVALIRLGADGAISEHLPLLEDASVISPAVA